MVDEQKVEQSIKDYRDLLIWKKGIELTKEIYNITSRFPSNEMYGLTSQLQRASVSIPSNIAEGQARQRSAEFCQFLRVSLGSLAEVETQMVIACELGFTSMNKLEDVRGKITELRKMIYSIQRKISTHQK
jgi:four helix bundle protein